MPLFMGTHNRVEGLSVKAVGDAHQRDVEVGAQYGVDYQHFWFDESSGRVYCLVEGPDAETVERVHREGHGLVADDIVEVQQGA